MPESVKILITLAGGLVQTVNANVPVHVIVEDYDDDVVRDEHETPNPHDENCVVTEWTPEETGSALSEAETVEDRFAWWRHKNA